MDAPTKEQPTTTESSASPVQASPSAPNPPPPGPFPAGKATEPANQPNYPQNLPSVLGAPQVGMSQPLQAQSNAWYPGQSSITPPPRTHSAPPDIQEQQQKGVNPSQYAPYRQPNGRGMPMVFGYPPAGVYPGQYPVRSGPYYPPAGAQIPPDGSSGQPWVPSPNPPNRERKPLAIIDPDTMEAVDVAGKLEEEKKKKEEEERKKEEEEEEKRKKEEEERKKEEEEEKKKKKEEEEREKKEEEERKKKEEEEKKKEEEERRKKEEEEKLKEVPIPSPSIGGKKVYTRQFLLQLKDSPLSMEKPQGFEHMAELLQPEQGQSRYERKDEWNRGGRGKAPPGFPANRGRGPQGGRGRGRGPKKSNSGPVIVLTEVKPLEQNEDAWKISKADDMDDTTIKLRKAKALLNKLTFEKFGAISDRILELGITSLDVLRGFIDLIFDKALEESHFSELYAALCLKLSLNSPEFKTGGKPQTFKRVLLTRCQEHFESVDKLPDDFDTMNDEDKEYTLLMIKLRTLGNVKFIGELYKRKMLTERIMHACTRRLLDDAKKGEAIDVEALVKLLTTIGPDLDLDKSGAEKMNAYFKRIKEMLDDKEMYESRLRFAMADLIDLRVCKWKARRVEAKATTLKESRSSGPGTPKVGGRNVPQPRNGGRGRPLVPPTTPQRTPQGRAGDRGAASVLPTPPSSENIGQGITLGPQGGMMSGQGAAGWKTVPGVGRGRGVGRGKGGASPTRSEPSPTPAVPLEDDVLARKSKTIIEEYALNKDMAEAKICVDELGHVNRVGFVGQALTYTAQLSGQTQDKERVVMVTSLLLQMVKDEVISPSNIKEALAKLMAVYENEIVADSPIAEDHVTTLLSRFIINDALPLSFLPTGLAPVVNTWNNQMALKLALKIISLIKGDKLDAIFINLAPLWAPEDMDAEDDDGKLHDVMMSETERKEYIELLTAANKLDLQPLVVVDDRLVAGLDNKDALIETLEGFSAQVKEHPCFIRGVLATLVRTIEIKAGIIHDKVETVDGVMKHHMFGDKEPTKDALESEKALWDTFVDVVEVLVGDDRSKQLLCLLEVQKVCDSWQFPKGLCNRLFDILYHGCIDEEVFFVWKEDEKEEDGKQNALFEVSKWLDWLKMAKEEEADEDEEEEES